MNRCVTQRWRTKLSSWTAQSLKMQNDSCHVTCVMDAARFETSTSCCFSEWCQRCREPDWCHLLSRLNHSEAPPPPAVICLITISFLCDSDGLTLNSLIKTPPRSPRRPDQDHRTQTLTPPWQIHTSAFCRKVKCKVTCCNERRDFLSDLHTCRAPDQSSYP